MWHVSNCAVGVSRVSLRRDRFSYLVRDRWEVVEVDGRDRDIRRGV